MKKVFINDCRADLITPSVVISAVEKALIVHCGVGDFVEFVV